MTDNLFPDLVPDQAGVERAARRELSAQKRRTLRQMDDVAAGIHPLTREPIDPNRAHFCGNCRWRSKIDPRFAKCFRETDGEIRMSRLVTHGAATDVRSWWPGCPRWERQP